MEIYAWAEAGMQVTCWEFTGSDTQGTVIADAETATGITRALTL